MIAPSPTVSQFTTIYPVPKPKPARKRRRAHVEVSRLAAHELVRAQGYAAKDIVADLEAAEALGVARAIDKRRDPLILEMARLFAAIRHDLNTSKASVALATRGEACALEAIRLDRITDEHGVRAQVQVSTSIEAGQAVVAVHEGLLTGVGEL